MIKRQSLLLISALFALSAADVSAAGAAGAAGAPGGKKITGAATAALKGQKVKRGATGQQAALPANEIQARGTDEARYSSYMSNPDDINGLGLDADMELQRSMSVGEERAATLTTLQDQLKVLDPKDPKNVREITRLSKEIKEVEGHIAANLQRQKNLAVFLDEFGAMTPEARGIVSQRRGEILGNNVEIYKEQGLRRRSPSQVNYRGLSEHVNKLAEADSTVESAAQDVFKVLQAKKIAELNRLPKEMDKETKEQKRSREDASLALKRAQEDEFDALNAAYPLPSKTVNLGDLADEFVAERAAESALSGPRPSVRSVSPTRPFNDSDLQFQF